LLHGIFLVANDVYYESTRTIQPHSDTYPYTISVINNKNLSLQLVNDAIAEWQQQGNGQCLTLQNLKSFPYRCIKLIICTISFINTIMVQNFTLLIFLQKETVDLRHRALVSAAASCCSEISF